MIDSVQSVSRRGRCDRRQNANDRTRFAALVGLRDFNIEVEIVAVHSGPVITRFELQRAPGIKASRITSLGQGSRAVAVGGQCARGRGDPG